MSRLIIPSFELLEKPLTPEEETEQRRKAARVILRGDRYWDKACQVVESRGVYQKDTDDYYYEINRLIMTWNMDDWIFGGV